jgi:phospholipid/cholesterol/gamma-HCH transport system substrate-binding protein
MKIANETKIGVLAVVALAGLILGFNFLKGSSLFNITKNYMPSSTTWKAWNCPMPCSDRRIAGRQRRGYQCIGQRSQPGYRGDDQLKKDVHIPKNSVGVINSGLISSASIVIDKGDDTHYLDDGDTLLTKQKSNLFSQVESSVNPVILKLGGTLTSLDSLIEQIGTMFDPRLKTTLPPSWATWPAQQPRCRSC